MECFERNVFINCPFDEDYRQLFLSVLFAVSYLGFIPRIALERSDSGESRVHKVLALINQSKYGIHDISRIMATQEGEHYRMNMPFELGIDYGCQKLKEGIWSSKKLLVLEKEKYRYRVALSDLSGSDIKNHNDDPQAIIKSVRNWFIPEEMPRGPSGNKIWQAFNDFNAYVYEILVEEDGHSSIDDVEIPEILIHMREWLKNRGNT